MGSHERAGRANQEALQGILLPRHERAPGQDGWHTARAMPRS